MVKTSRPICYFFPEMDGLFHLLPETSQFLLPGFCVGELLFNLIWGLKESSIIGKEIKNLVTVVNWSYTRLEAINATLGTLLNKITAGLVHCFADPRKGLSEFQAAWELKKN